MAPDGSGKTRLTDMVPEEFSPPVWSPDGSRLLIASAWSDDGPGSLYVVNADGSGATPVTAPGTYVEHPGWSADGDRILYWTVGPNGAGMYSVDTDGSDPQFVLPAAPAGGPLVAAPDGQTVAYVVYPEHESIPPDGEFDEGDYEEGTGE
jgi:Tol biopolymer transport system component